MKTVTMEEVKLIRALRQRRDEYACAIGRALVEGEQYRRELKFGRRVNDEKRGASLVEFERIKSNYMAKIDANGAEEVGVATQALRAAGVDPESATYSIDVNNGRILKLVGGVWREVE
jgi:hypothetical protein